MYSAIPIIGVVGLKNSGKTLIMEHLVKELRKEGFKVATAKHISQKGFSIDSEGKDTWKHSRAGANPVIVVSDVEVAVIIKRSIQDFSLDYLLCFMGDVDVILIEGFSRFILQDSDIGKIICLRNREEYEDYRGKVKGEILAFCSIKSLDQPVLRITEDLGIIVKNVIGYVKRRREIGEIINQLPKLDCGKCGFSSCVEMARAIYKGEAKLDMCKVLSLKPKLKTKVVVNESELPLQPFVSKIIRNAVLGMLSSLKGVSIKGDEKVYLEIKEE